MQLPIKCMEVAPDEINTYSDGCLKHPTSQWFALGGMVVWSQHQPRQATQPEVAEAQFGSIRIADGGGSLRLRNAILGQASSSTRCEAHGLLVGIARPGPVHIGIDN